MMGFLGSYLSSRRKVKADVFVWVHLLTAEIVDGDFSNVAVPSFMVLGLVVPNHGWSVIVVMILLNQAVPALLSLCTVKMIRVELIQAVMHWRTQHLWMRLPMVPPRLCVWKPARVVVLTWPFFHIALFLTTSGIFVILCRVTIALVLPEGPLPASTVSSKKCACSLTRVVNGKLTSSRIRSMRPFADCVIGVLLFTLRGCCCTVIAFVATWPIRLFSLYFRDRPYWLCVAIWSGAFVFLFKWLH